MGVNLTDYDNFTDFNSTFMCEDEDEESSLHSVVRPVLYGVIFLVGMLGNCLMTTVLLRRRRRMRITEIYLLHLGVADVMLLLTLPFELPAAAGAGWVFGELLCMLTGVLSQLNLFVGSLLLALIGFDRYLAIVHAIPSMQSRRPRRVHLACASLWLVALLLSVPEAVFLSVATEGDSSKLDCYHCRFGIHSHNWVLAKRVLNHLCFFFSLAVMSYCYAALVVTLCRSQRHQAKKGAMRLALLVTLVFCCCWLPYNVASLLQTLVDLDVVAYDACDFQVRLNRAAAVTQSLGVAHCCLNPFLYAFVGVRFRGELMQLLRRLCCGRVWAAASAGTRAHSRPSISEGTGTGTTTNTNF